jgi:hypothetical protein
MDEGSRFGMRTKLSTSVILLSQVRIQQRPRLRNTAFRQKMCLFEISSTCHSSQNLITQDAHFGTTRNIEAIPRVKFSKLRSSAKPNQIYGPKNAV